MPWNGSGGFNREEDFTADLASGLPNSLVSAQKVDDEFDNFQVGLQNCLTRDGQNSPSANINFAGNKITSLGTPTAGTDAANKNYVDAGTYLGAAIAAQTTETPVATDLVAFADISDSNNPKKTTAQGVVEAGLGQSVASLLALLTPVGTVAPYAGSTAPTGWLLARGQAVSRTTYAALFAVVGTTYGAGDGSTTFNLPDLQGRVVAGLEATATRLTSGVSGVDGGTLGASGGNQNMQQHTHTATVTDPGHTHNMNVPQGGTGYTGWLLNSGWANTTVNSAPQATSSFHNASTATGISVSNANTGTGTSQNVQPTIVLNYIIRT